MDINENDITLGYADFVDDESSEQSTEENNFPKKVHYSILKKCRT